jgi:hypothetical protein
MSERAPPPLPKMILCYQHGAALHQQIADQIALIVRISPQTH